MAKPKKKTLSDDDILAKVNAQVAKATGDTVLSKETEKVQRYYDQEYPKRQSEGNSSYVSSDVFDGVESMKAQLLETYTGSTDIIRLLPMKDEAAHAAAAETRYVEDVIHNQNPGFDILHDLIDDGLKSRKGVLQVYWEDRHVRDEHNFKNMPESDVMALAAQEDVSDLDAEPDEGYDPQSGKEPTYSGYWCRKIDKSQVKVENVPSEEYFFDGSKKRREDGVRGRRMLKTRAALINEGYDKDKVSKLTYITDIALSPEKQARDEATTGAFKFSDDPVQEELQTVELIEAYMDLSLYGDGKSCLYKIVLGDKAMFSCEEVDEDPFITFAPLRRPHNQAGNNFAARIIPTQNARTVLTRAVLDHTAQTTNPRWQVLNGGLPNPRELLDNRQGGVVNVRTREAIAPLNYPNLNPFVFETLRMLKDNKEEHTGISQLSQGLNKDAVSSQNSRGLVNDLVTLSQVRQKIVARNLAAALKELYLKVRKLVIEFDSRERVAEVVDDFQHVDPKLWHPERKVRVSLHIGYGEQEKEAAKFVDAWKFLTQDPTASKFCDKPRQWKLLTDGMRKNSFANYADYVMPPEQAEDPKPDPLQMKELEIKDKQAEASLLAAKSAAAKVQHTAEMDAIKVQMDQMKTMLEQALKTREADRQDLDTAGRIDVTQRETAVLEETEGRAADRDDLDTISSVDAKQRETAVLEKTPVTSPTAG